MASGPGKGPAAGPVAGKPSNPFAVHKGAAGKEIAPVVQFRHLPPVAESERANVGIKRTTGNYKVRVELLEFDI